MNRYLMCSYGAARILPQAPKAATLLGTVAVSSQERYRVLKTETGLWAVPLDREDS